MATPVQNERRRFQLSSWSGALIVLGILAAANFVLSALPMRLDTSSGHAYSVSPATKQVLGRLDDTLLVRIVFSRQLPPVYKVTERYLNDLLSEYKRASHGKVRVEVFDPGLSPKNRELAIDYGVVPIQLDVMERDRREVAERFMGVSFSYGDKTEAIPFVQDAQNLEILDCNCRNVRNVRALRTKRQCSVCTGIDRNKRRTVVALAVYHHEDLVSAKTAQRWRADES